MWELNLDNETPIARHFHMFPWHFTINIFIGRLLHLGSLSETFFRNCFSHQIRYRHGNTNFYSDTILKHFLSLFSLPFFPEFTCLQKPTVGRSTLGWSVFLKTRQSRNHARLSSAIWQMWVLAYVISICNYNISFVVSILLSCPSF